MLATALGQDHTQIELANLIGLDKTTMVTTVDALEEAGLAERRPSSADRRVRVIAVTKAGEAKVSEARKVIDQVQADVLARLPARERTALRAVWRAWPRTGPPGAASSGLAGHPTRMI